MIYNITLGGEYGDRAEEVRRQRERMHALWDRDPEVERMYGVRLKARAKDIARRRQTLTHALRP